MIYCTFSTKTLGGIFSVRPLIVTKMASTLQVNSTTSTLNHSLAKSGVERLCTVVRL